MTASKISDASVVKGRGVAGDALRSSPKPDNMSIFSHRRYLEILVAIFLHNCSAQLCLCNTPRRRTPSITGCFVSAVARGWVGAPKKRASFTFHGAVVGFVDRYLWRTQNLIAWNDTFRLCFSHADLGPTSAQEIFSYFSFSSLKLCC